MQVFNVIMDAVAAVVNTKHQQRNSRYSEEFKCTNIIIIN